MFDNTSIVIMYGVTPCHAGSGSTLGVVDLPIQRERHTNWPIIQASGVKGAFRVNFERFKNRITDRSQVNDLEKLTSSIFGSEESGGFAGSLSISDARILAYPMRSNVAPFVWITCPAVLKRLIRDLEIAGKNCKLDFKNRDTIFSEEQGSSKAFTLQGNIKDTVLLEDYEVTVVPNVKEIENLFKELKVYFENVEKLLLVSDEVFNYGVSDCTQIMAQISIDSETGTTKEGSLRYQEELPSDTIMYTVLHWGNSKNKTEDRLKADTIKKFITEEVIANHIQIGGDETLGRGIFKLEWK